MSATKGTKGNYRDLLWDFSTDRYRGRRQKGDYDQAGPQDTVELRVFSDEQEIYDPNQTPAQAQVFDIPIDAFSPLRKETGSARVESMPDASLLYDMGRRLWEAIPPAARQPLLDAIATRPCRLKISSSSPAIDDLPWEWLNDGQGPPFALRPEIRLARSVPVPVAAPPISFESPLRVLLVLTPGQAATQSAGNPKDERLLDPGREIDAIRPALSTGYYDLKILEEPTWDAFVQTVSPGGDLNVPYGREPHIVHYIGHAGVVRGEGNLILHDSAPYGRDASQWQNVTHWISGPELAQVLPLTVRLLCLSTCFTAPNYQILGLPRLAHTAALYRLPTTIANRYPVDEQGVRVFWHTFYTALARNRGNINEAFSKAQQATAGSPDQREWATESSGRDANWGSFSLVIRDQSGKMMRLGRPRDAGSSRGIPKGQRPPGKESLAAGGLEPTPPIPVDKPADDPRAIEIQAQLASRLANDLATKVRSYGPNAPGSMQKQYREEAARASDLIDKLRTKS